MTLRDKIGFGAICISIMIGSLLGYTGIAQTATQEGTIQLFPSDQLIVRVTPFRPEISRHDSPEVVFRVQNKTSSVLRLLKWGTPLDIGKSKPLRITKDGRAVAYLGVIALRGEPTSADFIEIQPSETYASAIALDRYYDFSEQGVYTIEWDTVLFGNLGSQVSTKIEHYVPIRKTAFIVVKEARPKQGPSAEQRRIISRLSGPAPKSVTEGCSNNQTQTLEAAQYRGAAKALELARNLRVNSNHDAPRYVNWFGAWDSYRYTVTWTTFEAIANVINTPQLNLHCGGDDCAPNTIAYVYESWSFFIWGSGPVRDIYLCPSYWAYDDSTKAGIIIHEASHIAKTDDYLYCWNETVCRNLANNSPNKAVDNADSYRGCAQDTSGWGIQPDRCASINDCPNGQFCLHDPVFGGSHCVYGPIPCDRNEDCGPGALCVSTHFMRTRAGQSGGHTPAPAQKYCVLY